MRDAEALARRHDCHLRVVMSNGARLNTTLDFVEHRINVRTRSGVVTTIEDVS